MSLPSIYPFGHLGHLTSNELASLNQFKVICETHQYYAPSREDTYGSHGDDTLLRFLRARKFVPEDAFRQFKATEDWRRDQAIDKWYDTIDIAQYEATRVLYTMWTGRCDKRGVPLYVLDIGGLNMKKITKAESSTSTADRTSQRLSPKLRALFATCEHLTNFVFPLCSQVSNRPYPETPISQTCCIVDISGVSIFQFWSLKAHLQDASALATAHYPETLGRTFIVGAPSFFPTIWNWIKAWLDPITVAKIVIVPASEVKSTLEEHINVQDIPRRYGGQLDWDFGKLPVLAPNVLDVMKLTGAATTIPTGPIRWMRSLDNTLLEAHALGTTSGMQRNEIVAHITR